MKKVNRNIVIRENEETLLPLLWTGEEKELTYNVTLVGNGAKLRFLALLLGDKHTSLQLAINVYHQKPETKSEIIVKSVLHDASHVNFQGLVKIEPASKGTITWLAAHILLLSKNAIGEATPSLEILENDISAGHATTVGRIDESELFYLMSRGLSEKKSTQLIVQGFLAGILKEFPKELAIKAAKYV